MFLGIFFFIFFFKNHVENVYVSLITIRYFNDVGDFFSASLIALKLLGVLVGTSITLSYTRCYLFRRPKETSFEFFSRNLLTLVHAIIFSPLATSSPRVRIFIGLPSPHPALGCISYFPARRSGFPPKHSFRTL